MIKQFEVSSPEELRDALAGTGLMNGARFAAVRVFGPVVLIRHFEHLKVSMPALLEALKLEAAQALSIASQDVEVACQFLCTQGDHFRGISTAMPRVYLEEYLHVFEAHFLAPVSLISLAAGMVEDHLKSAVAAGKDYCLVNFLKPQGVSVVVFLGGEPVFFREKYDALDGHVAEWLADTIRYCCGRSASKQIEEIICVGDAAGKEELVKKLKAALVSSRNGGETENGRPALKFSAPNLLDKYVLDLKERSAFSRCLTWGLILCVAAALLGAMRLADAHQKLSRAQAVGVLK